MAEATASTALLAHEIDRADDHLDRLGRGSRDAGNEVDRLSGRLRIAAEAAAVLGPSLIPIGGVGVAAVAGLASQFGLAAAGAGTMVLALQGVGDALTAVNKAGLDPTAANLEAARRAMANLSPAAQGFVNQLHDLIPQVKELRDAAADGLLPGASEGLKSLMVTLPRLEGIVSGVSRELGHIAEDTGRSLSSDRWKPFLDFIGAEAPGALADLAQIVGNTGHALAELWMAFTPTNHEFSQFLVDATADIDRWAAHLSKTQGFQEFIAYIDETGPQVAATFGAIAEATLQIVQAASPLGGPVLQGLEAIAKAVAAIADSDLGTPIFTAIAALSILNRSLKATEALTAFGARLETAGLKARTFSENLTRANLAKSALLLGGLAIAGTGAADSIGLTSTAALGFAGLARGPWGLAIGTAIGFTLDLAHANDQVAAALNNARVAADSSSVAQIKAAKAALVAQAASLASGNSFNDNLARIGAFISGNDQDLVSRSQELDRRLDELQHGALPGIGVLLTQSLGRPARQAALDVDGAATAAARFDAALDGMNRRLTQSQNLIAARQALRDLADVVKQNPLGRRLDTGPGELGAQGDAVRSQLLEIIRLNGQAAAGIANPDKQVAFIRTVRGEILTTAAQLKLPVAAVQELLDKFGLVDRTKLTPKVDPAPFKKGLREIETDFDRFINGDYSVKVKPVLSDQDALRHLLLGPLGSTNALGGIYGDVANAHQPQLAGPGPVRVWREPETMGEAYIPLANDFRRPRAVDIWEQTGRALGVQFQRYAYGGMTGSWTSSSGGVTLDDLRDLVASMQPMIGQQIVQPHDYNEFRREQEQTRRLAGVGGSPRGTQR